MYVSRTEDERLNTIKEKVMSKVAFEKYLSETVHETENLEKPIVCNTGGDTDSSDDQSTGGDTDSSDDQSTGSSVEGDDSETDPDYNPAKDVDDEDTPSKAKKPKTTNKGNNRHLCYRIVLKDFAYFPILYKYWVCCICMHLIQTVMRF